MKDMAATNVDGKFWKQTYMLILEKPGADARANRCC